MKIIPLLPRYFQWIGIALLAIFMFIQANEDFNPTVQTFVLVDDSPMQSSVYFRLKSVEIGYTLTLLTSVLGLSLIAFARKKQEDEMLHSIRLHSWSWAIITAIVLFTLCTVFVYGMTFLSCLSLFPQFLLLTFILIFHVNLYKISRKEKA